MDPCGPWKRGTNRARFLLKRLRLRQKQLFFRLNTQAEDPKGPEVQSLHLVGKSVAKYRCSPHSVDPIRSTFFFVGPSSLPSDATVRRRRRPSFDPVSLATGFESDGLTGSIFPPSFCWSIFPTLSAWLEASRVIRTLRSHSLSHGEVEGKAVPQEGR